MLLNGLPQQIIDGVVLGAVYALFAAGYTLIFAMVDVLNFGHAAIALAGALAAWWLLAGVNAPPVAALPAAALLAGALGWAANRLAFAPLRRRAASRLSLMVAGLAVATILQGLAPGFSGTGTHLLPASGVPSGGLAFASVSLSAQQLLVLLLVVLLLALLCRLMLTTRYGRAVRAIAENPRAAALLGIDVERVIGRTFFLAAALGGVAGVLYGLASGGASLGLSEPLQLRGLAIVVLGGMGSIPGAVIGGFTLALLETLSGGLLAPQYGDLVPFLVLFLALLLRPSGLLGRHNVREA